MDYDAAMEQKVAETLGRAQLQVLGMSVQIAQLSAQLAQAQAKIAELQPKEAPSAEQPT